MAKPEELADKIVRENLVRFRKEAAMSQADAADAADIPLDNLRRYESGKTATVPGTVLATLARVYGHTIEDFHNPEPPKAKLDERPIFFLKTRPGAEVDEKLYAELLEVIEKANKTATTKRGKR